MKKLLWLGLAGVLRCLPLAAQGVHSVPDKPSVHGMLLFGREKVYASHLPMFHAPHNYQVLLELDLAAKDQARFVKVLYAERFAEGVPASPTTNYLLFGNAKEQFAAHVIRRAPDFDHIQQVKAALPAGAAFTEVVVNDKANAVPGTGGNTIEATTRAGQKLPVTWLRQLYLEFDDLR